MQKDPQVISTATLEATISPQTVIQVTPPGEYPGTPEGVVHAFLTIFPENPADAIQYLSPDLVSGLDETSLQNLLQLPGSIDGYMMLEGSGSAESEMSRIKVAISSNQQTFTRSFTLVIQNGFWQIKEIATQ